MYIGALTFVVFIIMFSTLTIIQIILFNTPTIMIKVPFRILVHLLFDGSDTDAKRVTVLGHPSRLSANSHVNSGVHLCCIIDATFLKALECLTRNYTAEHVSLLQCDLFRVTAANWSG